MLARLAMRIVAEVTYAWTCVEYWVRPYDMLADARRWFWERPQRCGFSFAIRLPDPDGSTHGRPDNRDPASQDRF